MNGPLSSLIERIRDVRVYVVIAFVHRLRLRTAASDRSVRA
jgi:hypothetical protein